VIYDSETGLIVTTFCGVIQIFESMVFDQSWVSSTRKRQQAHPSMRSVEDVTIASMDFSKSLKLIATGGVEGRLVLIDPNARIITSHVKAHNTEILDVYFYDSHFQIITIAIDRTVNIWDTNKLELV